MKLLSIFYILSCSCWKWECAGFCSEKLNAKKTRLYFYNVFDVYFNSNKLYNLRVDAVAMFVENFNLKQNGFKSLFLIQNPFISCCLPSVKFIPYIICIIMTGNLLISRMPKTTRNALWNLENIFRTCKSVRLFIFAHLWHIRCLSILFKKKHFARCTSKTHE